MIYIILYLLSIVLANLTVAKWGIGMAYFNAFVFISLDLTSRDKLHEAWHNKGLLWKMTLLIASGSFLSWLLNKDAGQIAVASFVAFACASVADTITYHFLREKHQLLKINGSNVVSSLVDSVVFPTIAFGGVNIMSTIILFLSKIVGGFFWSLLLTNNKRKDY